MSDDLKSQRENGRIVVNVMKSIGSASLRQIQDAVLENMVVSLMELLENSRKLLFTFP